MTCGHGASRRIDRRGEGGWRPASQPGGPGSRRARPGWLRLLRLRHRWAARFAASATRRSSCSGCWTPTAPTIGFPSLEDHQGRNRPDLVRPAISGASSVFTFATFTWPSLPAAHSSRIGDWTRQGPHHGAQKSTRTRPLCSSTSASNVSLRQPRSCDATSCRPPHSWKMPGSAHRSQEFDRGLSRGPKVPVCRGPVPC